MSQRKSPPSRSRLDLIGGEPAVHLLVERFYRAMNTLPEAAHIRAMHEALSVSQERFELFLIEWLGGAKIYSDAFGAPRLRARHSHLTVTHADKEAWMLCMRWALSEVMSDETLSNILERDFDHIAEAIVNAR